MRSGTDVADILAGLSLTLSCPTRTAMPRRISSCMYNLTLTEISALSCCSQCVLPCIAATCILLRVHGCTGCATGTVRVFKQTA